ncbi:MAG: hypothetical protein RLZZ447_1820 [Verrucomicrobiota bacterium]
MAADDPKSADQTNEDAPSSAFSWGMTGFLLGAACVYAYLRPRPAETVPPPPASVADAPPAVPPRRLSTVEAVFAEWGERATWTGNVTEIALWSSAAGAFAEFYEVRRIGGQLYFRSIPALTRRVIRRGKEEPACPLLFTETEAEYREWLQHGRTERPAEALPAQPFTPSR